MLDFVVDAKRPKISGLDKSQTKPSKIYLHLFGLLMDEVHRTKQQENLHFKSKLTKFVKQITTIIERSSASDDIPTKS